MPLLNRTRPTSEKQQSSANLPDLCSTDSEGESSSSETALHAQHVQRQGMKNGGSRNRIGGIPCTTDAIDAATSATSSSKEFGGRRLSQRSIRTSSLRTTDSDSARNPDNQSDAHQHPCPEIGSEDVPASFATEHRGHRERGHREHGHHGQRRRPALASMLSPLSTTRHSESHKSPQSDCTQLTSNTGRKPSLVLSEENNTESASKSPSGNRKCNASMMSFASTIHSSAITEVPSLASTTTADNDSTSTTEPIEALHESLTRSATTQPQPSPLAVLSPSHPSTPKTRNHPTPSSLVNDTQDIPPPPIDVYHTPKQKRRKRRTQRKVPTQSKGKDSASLLSSPPPPPSTCQPTPISLASSAASASVHSVLLTPTIGHRVRQLRQEMESMSSILSSPMTPSMSDSLSSINFSLRIRPAANQRQHQQQSPALHRRCEGSYQTMSSETSSNVRKEKVDAHSSLGASAFLHFSNTSPSHTITTNSNSQDKIMINRTDTDTDATTNQSTQSKSKSNSQSINVSGDGVYISKRHRAAFNHKLLQKSKSTMHLSQSIDTETTTATGDALGSPCLRRSKSKVEGEIQRFLQQELYRSKSSSQLSDIKRASAKASGSKVKHTEAGLDKAKQDKHRSKGTGKKSKRNMSTSKKEKSTRVAADGSVAVTARHHEQRQESCRQISGKESKVRDDRQEKGKRKRKVKDEKSSQRGRSSAKMRDHRHGKRRDSVHVNQEKSTKQRKADVVVVPELDQQKEEAEPVGERDGDAGSKAQQPDRTHQQRYSCPAASQSRSLSPATTNQRLVASFSGFNPNASVGLQKPLGTLLPKPGTSVLNKSASFLDAIAALKQTSPGGDDSTCVSFASFSRNRSSSGYASQKIRSSRTRMEIKPRSPSPSPFYSSMGKCDYTSESEPSKLATPSPVPQQNSRLVEATPTDLGGKPSPSAPQEERDKGEGRHRRGSPNKTRSFRDSRRKEPESSQSSSASSSDMISKRRASVLAGASTPTSRSTPSKDKQQQDDNKTRKISATDPEKHETRRRRRRKSSGRDDSNEHAPKDAKSKSRRRSSKSTSRERSSASGSKPRDRSKSNERRRSETVRVPSKASRSDGTKDGKRRGRSSESRRTHKHDRPQRSKHHHEDATGRRTSRSASASDGRRSHSTDGRKSKSSSPGRSSRRRRRRSSNPNRSEGERDSEGAGANTRMTRKGSRSRSRGDHGSSRRSKSSPQDHGVDSSRSDGKHKDNTARIPTLRPLPPPPTTKRPEAVPAPRLAPAEKPPMPNNRSTRSTSPDRRTMRRSQSERNIRSASPARRHSIGSVPSSDFGSQVSFAIDEYSPPQLADSKPPVPREIRKNEVPLTPLVSKEGFSISHSESTESTPQDSGPRQQFTRTPSSLKREWISSLNWSYHSERANRPTGISIEDVFSTNDSTMGPTKVNPTSTSVRNEQGRARGQGGMRLTRSSESFSSLRRTLQSANSTILNRSSGSGSDDSSMNPMLQKVRLWNEHFVLPKEKQYCRGVIEYANQKFHISSQSLALTAPTSASSIPSLSSMEKDTRSSLLASLAPSSRSLGSGVTRSLDNCHASSATDCDVFAAAHKHHLDEVGYGKNYMEEARLRHKLKRSRDQKRY